MEVKEIKMFLKKYGFPEPEEDQGAALIDTVDSDTVSLINFE